MMRGGRPAPHWIPNMIGSSVAHYRITDKLGEGGVGSVYRAQDTKLGRDVAIKVLPPSLANDADYTARFQREAQVLYAQRSRAFVHDLWAVPFSLETLKPTGRAVQLARRNCCNRLAGRPCNVCRCRLLRNSHSRPAGPKTPGNWNSRQLSSRQTLTGRHATSGCGG